MWPATSVKTNYLDRILMHAQIDSGAAGRAAAAPGGMRSPTAAVAGDSAGHGVAAAGSTAPQVGASGVRTALTMLAVVLSRLSYDRAVEQGRALSLSLSRTLQAWAAKRFRGRPCAAW